MTEPIIEQRKNKIIQILEKRWVSNLILIAVIVITLSFWVYIYKNLDLLNTGPCDVCQKAGFSCFKLPEGGYY